MTNTERKLDEAKYFFTRLDIDDPYFDYNLSAFLNAARSVTWIMRHEFNKTPGWEIWFKEYYLSEKTQDLLKEINELRVETTKRAGVKTDFFFLQTDLYVDEKYFPDLQRFKYLEDGEYIISIESLSDEPSKLDEEAIKFVGEINRKDRPYDGVREKLKNRCEEYLKIMTSVVNACINKFVISE